MLGSYETLTNEKVNLSSLTAQEKAWMGQMVKVYQSGESYPQFVNRINEPGCPALGGGSWVTPGVSRSPLYRACQDLADRLGIAQGFLAVSMTAQQEKAGPAESAQPSYLSCEEAAERVGVTSEAIRKAIREDRLPAMRVGRTYLLDSRAIDGYAARSGRQGRKFFGRTGTKAAPRKSTRQKRSRVS